jgi:hypothetical protein
MDTATIWGVIYMQTCDLTGSILCIVIISYTAKYCVKEHRNTIVSNFILEAHLRVIRMIREGVVTSATILSHF